MRVKNLTQKNMAHFAEYLRTEEKSDATQEKYLRDVAQFFQYIDGREDKKELVMDWKRNLTEKGYAVCSINSMLAAVNCFLLFIGRGDCKVKHIKTQKRTYCARRRNWPRQNICGFCVRLKKTSG